MGSHSLNAHVHLIGLARTRVLRFQRISAKLRGQFIHPLFIRNRVQRRQKLKIHLLRTQTSKVLRLKPGAGLCIAMHATPTARNFFLANFYPPDPFTYFSSFFQKASRVFPVLAVAKTGSCMGPQNKIGHPSRPDR